MFRCRQLFLMAGITLLLGGCCSEFTLDISVEPDDTAGTVLRYPDQETYQKNETVTLTAVPNEGYVFLEWAGDLAGYENPTRMTIGKTADSLREAVFERIKNTITFNIDKDLLVIARFERMSGQEGETAPVEGESVEGEGEIVTEGEGEVLPEGEGEVLPESEGEILPEGEGEVLPEGEGEVVPEGEGEVLPEGEGEVLPEGEGEVLAEGEGEVLPEGEGEVLPEGEGEVLPEGEGEVVPEGEVYPKVKCARGRGEVLPEGEGEKVPEGEGNLPG